MSLWPSQSKESRSNYYRQKKIKHPEWILWDGAKTRAASKGLDFTILPEDIFIPDVCPYLKTPFEYGTRYAMSLDRINNDLGYVKGNIEVISRKANSMKNDASVEELLEFAYEILERH